MKDITTHDGVDLEWYTRCPEKAKEDYRQAIQDDDSQKAERIKTILYRTGKFNSPRSEENSDEQIFARIKKYLNN